MREDYRASKKWNIIESKTINGSSINIICRYNIYIIYILSCYIYILICWIHCPFRNWYWSNLLTVYCAYLICEGAVVESNGR